MRKRHFFALGLFLLATGFIVSCSKINLATELGQGLIPEVDNIHTFDTTLEVETFNGIFTAANDSFRSSFEFPQILGKIDNDPIFGKTDARLYFQVSPQTKTPFLNEPSKLQLDSVVLVLNNTFIYGDTAMPQTINISEIAGSNDFQGDTMYLLSKQMTTAGLLGSRTIVPHTLKDSVTVIDFKDGTADTTKVANQLRVRLDDAFGRRLLAYDSAGANDGYSTDSVFRSKFKGFALESAGAANTLLGISMLNAQLQVYYRYENKTTAGDMDTATTFFNFQKASSVTLTGNENGSSNYIARDFGGTQIEATGGDAIADPLVYIANTPGTYATVKIPGLATFPNSVIHLAELQMESVFDNSDTTFTSPENMFLDVLDSTDHKYKLVPYVFGLTYSSGYAITNFPAFYSVNSSGNGGHNYYFKKDPQGHLVRQWRFNITGYAQKIALEKVPLFDFRLYAPAGVGLPLGDRNPVTGESKFSVPQSGNLFGMSAVGRVRLGGGNHQGQKMKLRIVYSKL
ncbi:DUF4270 family protein [Niabella drilacis]|uniref:DUF4270 family protein n=1 Tax=Niabella drilacis (strain DSM 25811 / CCM 8410 / CCUG 62505 / LMG 26954 / E90) TaxID=1285928 RepID=UPI0015A40C66|nr:DUF4270 family protein [Niabella drilacis]